MKCPRHVTFESLDDTQPLGLKVPILYAPYRLIFSLFLLVGVDVDTFCGK